MNNQKNTQLFCFGHIKNRRGTMSGSVYISMEESGRIVEDRGECWEFDFSKQLPISHIDVRDDKAIVAIGALHLNYQIWTHLRTKKWMENRH